MTGKKDSSVKKTTTNTQVSNAVASKTTPTVKKTAKHTVDKKKKKSKYDSFSTYIYKVLKQIHNDVGISKKSMDIMNSFVKDIYDKIAIEAANLTRIQKKHTLSAREIGSAVKLLLPGELSKHAVVEGAKAINKYSGQNSLAH
jgi:histone H2B